MRKREMKKLGTPTGGGPGPGGRRGRSGGRLPAGAGGLARRLGLPGGRPARGAPLGRAPGLAALARARAVRARVAAVLARGAARAAPVARGGAEAGARRGGRPGRARRGRRRGRAGRGLGGGRGGRGRRRGLRGRRGRRRDGAGGRPRRRRAVVADRHDPLGDPRDLDPLERRAVRHLDVERDLLARLHRHGDVAQVGGRRLGGDEEDRGGGQRDQRLAGAHRAPRARSMVRARSRSRRPPRVLRRARALVIAMAHCSSKPVNERQVARSALASLDEMMAHAAASSARRDPR